MPLHVSFCHLQCHCYFSASFDSCNFSALCLRDQIWVVNEQTGALLERAEEFEERVPFDRSEHSNLFLHNTRLDWNMGATVCFHVFLTINVHSCAVDDQLWPAMWVHRSESCFERQVPVYSVWCWLAISALKCMLALTWFVSARQVPVTSRHEIILHSEPI